MYVCMLVAYIDVYVALYISLNVLIFSPNIKIVAILMRAVTFTEEE
jgi:hypothetical protein